MRFGIAGLIIDSEMPWDSYWSEKERRLALLEIVRNHGNNKMDDVIVRKEERRIRVS